MKYLILVLLVGACWAQSPPDAPQPQPKPKTAFFSFRTWQEPVLKPNKRSWAIFVAAHAAEWGALAVANRQKEPWHSEAPAVAAITGLDLLIFKGMSPAMSWEGGVYGVVHYLRAR
jgi:hypothetical protein